jgi:methylmalonyl-CoA mutase
MHYEHLKHSGEFPIIGVNTFLSSTGSPTVVPDEVIRATEEEKTYQIDMLASLNKANEVEVKVLLKRLQTAAINHENIFELMMDACKVCSLGQIVSSLFDAGGQYRRNM